MRNHEDHGAYRKFTRKAEIEKSVNSLLGLVEGISIDSEINSRELQFLQAWIDDHAEQAARHPFNELVPVVGRALSDGVLTSEEKQDIAWLCRRLTSAEYFDEATVSMQKLHAILGGIGSDGVISVAELRELGLWLQSHAYLRSCWPYDEVDSLVTATLEDEKVDVDEHALLMQFFGEFTSIYDSNTIVNPKSLDSYSVAGICAMCPDIRFSGSTFVFTGTSHKYSRRDFEQLIIDLGGNFSDSVSRKVSYLVIGSEGNPCWAYACYGRKVEKAVQLRKEGHRILIIHENDFHDAVADR